ncbi:MAG: S8 family serine peptidase [Rhodobacter sp.]|nr:S8 family serine peptidase [Rhodobacter sp.]
MAALEKLNPALYIAYSEWRSTEADAHGDEATSLTLRFEGDLAAIEALGFETMVVEGDTATGILRFRDISAVSEHPGVLSLSIGTEPRLQLDTAVHDIRARASAATKIGYGSSDDGLWHAGLDTAKLTAHPDATGDGVIVAVIDTGIDFAHPAFMKTVTSSAKTTRILRIWDQGLRPASLGECPSASLLRSTRTYGVEFLDNPDAAQPAKKAINAALAGTTTINHRDCDGHGTHVASIAAGRVHLQAGTDRARIGQADDRFNGVAPKADIIAVKFIDVGDNVRFRRSSGFGAKVDDDTRLRDAVMYCLRTARALGKPVVINMSFGSPFEAGDGLDAFSRWLDTTIDPSHPAAPVNADRFPSGAIVVSAIGNDGDPGERLTAEITVPAGGQVTVPFELKDSRGGQNTRWLECTDKLHKPAVGVAFWYARTVPHTALTVALRLPHQADFLPSERLGIGGPRLDRGFIVRGTPRRAVFVTGSNRHHRAILFHSGTEGSINHPDGGTLRRHAIFLDVHPKVRSGVVSYFKGIYELRFFNAGADAVTLFTMCAGDFWAAGKFVDFQIARHLMDDPPPAAGGPGLPAGIDVKNDFSATDPLGRHAISVSSYRDSDGHIVASSSRGPLRDFSRPPGSLARIGNKPDIAAPGDRITAAKSFHEQSLMPPRTRTPKEQAGNRFQTLGGTSMAAPMVAGTVALLLEKEAGLNTTQVRSHLTTSPRAAVDPSVSPARERAYGAGRLDAQQSHDNIP